MGCCPQLAYVDSMTSHWDIHPAETPSRQTDERKKST
jgi:hypothetical protein